jgi:hypothetical protein
MYPCGNILVNFYVCLYVKCPLLLKDVNQNWNVSRKCIKLLQYQITLKSINLF